MQILEFQVKLETTNESVRDHSACPQQGLKIVVETFQTRSAEQWCEVIEMSSFRHRKVSRTEGSEEDCLLSGSWPSCASGSFPRRTCTTGCKRARYRRSCSALKRPSRRDSCSRPAGRGCSALLPRSRGTRPSWSPSLAPGDAETCPAVESGHVGSVSQPPARSCC